MCGIAGWVDFERDLSGERDLADTLTETMACRGPDAAGIWLHRHVALGHRRLAVIDPEGGRQPMSCEQDGREAAALTYSGEVYNFRELRRELESLGHRFRTRSDTEVVLRGYQAWGPALVHRLNGMYAFALWDVPGERLLLVRDRMGIKPLYYAPLPGGALFGSEPKALLAHPRFPAAVDLDGLRELFAFSKTPGTAVWRGMREVRPGGIVTVGRQGLSEATYWRLEARPHEDDLPATVRTVRELLEDVVDRQLVADVPLCTLLSGGLDSSLLTALAARRLRRQDAGPVRSFAVDFAGHGEDFRPDALRGTPDAPFARAVARHVGARHEDVVLRSQELADPDARWAALRARDLPIGLGDTDISLYLLFRAIRTHSTVAISGESADEVFGGYPWFHDPKSVAADTFPWLPAVSAVTAAHDLLEPGLAARLDLPGYRAQRWAEAVAEVGRVHGEDAHERRMREICYLNLTRFLQGLLDRKDRMSMAVGLEVRVPFCDHRLAEYVFNVPWRMKAFDGREKSLLRAAASDLLPGPVLHRRKSPYPVTQDPGYETAMAAEVGRVLADGSAPVLQVLAPGRVRALACRRPDEPASRRRRRGLELVLALNSWLSGYRPRLLL